MALPIDPAILLSPLALITLAAAFAQIRQNQVDLKKRQKEIDQRIYETLILQEISERIGYELNIGRILDTIIDSLSKFLPFSLVSYMLIGDDPTKVNFRVHLEEVVGHEFLNTVKKYQLDTLNKVSGTKFTLDDLVEMITGTIVDDVVKEPPASIWVTPIFINIRGIGALAIASKKAGLYQGPEMAVLTKILTQANRAVNNLEFIIASEQHKLNAMVTSMADGVLMFDKDLNLLVANPAALTLLGLPSDTKPNIFGIARALADKIDLRTKLDESVKSDHLVSLDKLEVGGKISQLLITPVKDDKQRLLGTVVLFRDRTAEFQLGQLREEFTAMMVHELRAPLTVVRGTTDMFIKKPELPATDQGKTLMKTMHTSASSMLSMVNDLLDAAKIESGKFQIVKTPGNLTEVISERASFFTPLASSRSLTLAVENLPTDLILEFDRERIAQVLNNLISNAIKFTPPGGRITISAQKIQRSSDIKWRFGQPGNIPIDEACILISVADTGEGIASERVNELFSKFKQLHPAEQEPGGTIGTGLGLVIAKGIVESHEGQIFFESRLNEGSTFYFTIPLA